MLDFSGYHDTSAVSNFSRALLSALAMPSFARSSVVDTWLEAAFSSTCTGQHQSARSQHPASTGQHPSAAQHMHACMPPRAACQRNSGCLLSVSVGWRVWCCPLLYSGPRDSVVIMSPTQAPRSVITSLVVVFLSSTTCT